jgi:hypothetical protein
MKQPATPKARLTTSGLMERTGLGCNALRFYEEKGSSGQRSATTARYWLYAPAVVLDPVHQVGAQIMHRPRTVLMPESCGSTLLHELLQADLTGWALAGNQRMQETRPCILASLHTKIGTTKRPIFRLSHMQSLS